MHRTTVRLNERVLRDAKKLAAETGKTLTKVIEDSLRETVARSRRFRARRKIRLRTFGGKGVLPGVDLDNSAGLRDLMDA